MKVLFCLFVMTVLFAGGERTTTWAAPAMPLESDGVLFAGTGAVSGAPASSAALLPSARPKTAEISLRFHNVPGNAQVAIDAAAANWERQIVSPVPIVVDVTWVDLGGEDLLGRVRARGALKDDGVDAKLPVADVIYPMALANVIRGSRLDDEPDVVVEMNSSADWYFGLDGLPPPRTFDLVTVAMHEIGQGLGVMSRFDIVAGKPIAGGGKLSIYDTFLTNSRGQAFATLLGSDPAGLKRAMTSGDAYFSGSNARKAAGAPPRLHAEVEWARGSSLSHLNSAEFGPPGDNALFAPFLYDGWAFHDPGPVLLAILRDIGWEIPGLGEPARLSIARLPSAVAGGGKTQLNVIVSVRDPLGALVASDNTTVVGLVWFRSPTTTPGDCVGETSIAKPVIAGAATFRGCFVGGYGRVWYRAYALGLAPGSSNVVTLARVTTVGPMVSHE